MGVCDISADYEGCIEFTKRFTSIEEPFLIYHGQEEKFYEKISDANDDNSVLFHCVDHLPAEMPQEASNHFGSQLLPFVAQVAKSDQNIPFADQEKDLPPQIYKAIICSNGALTPGYKYISELRKIAQREKSQQKVYESESEKDPNEEEPEDKDAMRSRPFRLIPRSISMVMVSLRGHLFDTRCFNNCLDVCEQHKIQFKVVEWNVGNQES